MHPPYGFMDLLSVVLPDWFFDNVILDWYFSGQVSLNEILVAGNWLVDNVIFPLNTSG